MKNKSLKSSIVDETMYRSNERFSIEFIVINRLHHWYVEFQQRVKHNILTEDLTTTYTLPCWNKKLINSY